MKQNKKIGYHQYLFKTIILIFLVILIAPSPSAQAVSIKEPKLCKEQRDDGLILVIKDQDKNQPAIQHLTMILRTGSAHDPVGKSGLTNLTNEIIYYLLRNTCALQVDYQIYADYSQFHFIVTRNEFNLFCDQLDQIIRADALLGYDICNELINYHLNLPKTSELIALSQLYSLVYGPDHPYNYSFAPSYDRLNINEVNKWFRRIYRPNNLIIAAGIKPPDDFLRRPVGRDTKEAVALDSIPASAGNVTPELRWMPVRDNIVTVCLGFETSQFGTEGLSATVLLQKYLDQKIWKIIREDQGLNYDPEVFYQLTGTSNAPMLLVMVHTLAENTGTVINLILTQFKEIAASGIPEEDLNNIIEQERKRWRMMENEPESSINAAALYGLLGQDWLINQKNYFTILTAETEIVPQIMSAGLARLKISVTGPKETGEYLNDVTSEMEFINK